MIAAFFTEMKGLNRSQKKRLGRIVLSALLWGVLALIHPAGLWGLLYLVPYLVCGYDVLFDAFRNILKGRVFDENFLMCIATIGAFGCGEYPEGVMVMVLYQLGELFQSVAVGRSRDSISALMELCPDEARVLQDDGWVLSDPDEVSIGMITEVWPGEKVPLDGIVCSGTSTLDTSPLTGESLPRPLQPGEAVYSGCVNLSGVIQVEVTREAEESSTAKIIEMMESATEKKAKTEKFITRFARVYTPTVCIAAALLAIIPSLITGQWQTWIYRAMTFLVISCPCALVISVPLTFFGGIGMASRQGILVKSGGDIEKLAEISTGVFDKTGTLTSGRFAVVGIEPVGIPEAELLEKAASAEAASAHPIARSIVEAYGKTVDESQMSCRQEQAGHGVSVILNGKTILAGSGRFLREKGVSGVPEATGGTTVFVSEDGVYQGKILCQDTVKPETAEALGMLKKLGVKNTVMLTGDDRNAALPVGAQLGLGRVYSNLLPGDKLDRMEQLLQENHTGYVCYVGDGVNDAPVLRRADIGIAMGAFGTDAAMEAADVVLMEDDLRKLPKAVEIARKTMRIAKENIVFALGVKLLVMLLGALGIANMYLAVFADVGVAMLAILNACRLMSWGRKENG